VRISSVPWTDSELIVALGVVVNVLCGSPVQQRPSPAGYPWLGNLEICTVRNRLGDNIEFVQRVQLLAEDFVQVT
jgi:hypothetical protein